MNAQDRMDRTALHLAAEEGHNEVVKVLLDHKDLDVNAKDAIYRSALHVAAGSGNDKGFDIIRLFIEKIGVDTWIEGQRKTPFEYFLISYSWWRREKASVLLHYFFPRKLFGG